MTRRNCGITLIELLVALLLTAFLLLGLVQLVTAAGTAMRLQDNQAQLQDQARFAMHLLADAVGQAAYSPEPWNPDFEIEGIAAQTMDSVSANSDRLVVRSWSDLNCFDNRNPDTQSGKPRFYIRESTFELNGSGNLARGCRYGPSLAELVTQVRRQGIVPGVESFQLLFGDDQDQDGNVDRWVRAGHWSNERRVLGVRAGLLLAGPGAVVETGTRVHDILDVRISSRADGKLRQAIELTLALRSRRR
jgi:type IV pilus assembly protein PilW